MSDLAVRDLETRRDSIFSSLRNLLVTLFGRESDHGLPPGMARHRDRAFRSATPPPLHVAPSQDMAAATTGDHRWERHPQLRARRASPAQGGERAARFEAERGLILARGGKLVEAVEAFGVAARDPEIDLAALPGFWDLPRNGMLTAVRAYERAERHRDAAALEARIRHLLRPRAIRTAPAASPGRLTASGD